MRKSALVMDRSMWREQDGEELVVHREPVHGRGIHGEAGEQILARAGRNPESGGGLEGGDGDWDGTEFARKPEAGEVVGPRAGSGR